MGLGLYKEGSGISAAKFFSSKGAEVAITDLKNEEELKKQISELKRFAKKLKAISYKLILGRHRTSDFKSADIVIRNPGARANSPYLAAARSAGAKILSDTGIFLALMPGAVIGVTGTRGKSTTSALAYEMLKSKERHAELGGNILRSPLNFLDKMHEGSIAVLELSSWQCEGLEEIKKSPHIAVITNIMRDHLNTYKGMAQYAAAKALIYKYQSPEDAVILNYDNKWTREMGKRAPSRRFWFSLKPFSEENGCFPKNKKIIFRFGGEEEAVASVSDTAIAGEHNLGNALSAVCAAKIMGISNAAIKKVLKNFKGLPNRMEVIRNIKGIRFINDTTATTPDATIAALKTLKAKSYKLKAKRRIVLICGGSDKKLEFSELALAIKKYAKSVVFLPGGATDKIKKFLKMPYEEAADMARAVRCAIKFAKKGDVVLLSPAAASFGLFQNEFDRGEQFVKEVKKLK